MEKKYIIVEFDYDNDGIAHDYIPSNKTFMYNEEQTKSTIILRINTHKNDIAKNIHHMETALSIYDEYVGKEVTIDYPSSEKPVFDCMYNGQTISGKFNYSKISYESRKMIQKETIAWCMEDEKVRYKKFDDILDRLRSGECDITQVGIDIYKATGISIPKVVELQEF